MSSSQNRLKKHIIHKTIWQLVVEPSSKIENELERNKASLVSALLFFFFIGILNGIIYSYLFTPFRYVAYTLSAAQLGLFIAYIISRTRHYKYAIIISLIILLLIPLTNVVASSDHSEESLITLLIWGLFPILLSSIILSVKATIILSSVNLLLIFSLPLFFKDITLSILIVPLIFYSVYPTMITILTHHRNIMEKFRRNEIKKINKRLQFELNERKKIEEKLAYSAMHDPLTNLPNRTLFMDRLTHAKAYSRRNPDYTFAVCFIDLDRFKVINDSLGHNIGDMLIVECAKRILSSIRDADTVGRLGGDEFVLLLEGANHPEEYIHIIERIQEKLLHPAVIEEHTVYISVSIGIVLDTKNYETADELLRNADVAMYQTKKEERGHYRIFDVSMLEGVMTRIEIENDLRNALDNKEFIIHYQPILDIATKKTIGFEALIRWMHPKKGMIPPNDFISIIEDMGLIVPIGYWVIDEATRTIKQWQDAFDPNLSINVNLSTRQCIQSNLAEKIHEIIRKNQLDPSTLKLELTESLIIKDARSISKTLEKLRSLGVQVQIDDFGTGYSSLGYLHNLPIDTLKIDRTFVSRLGGNNSGADIVQTILALAHGLGMQVIAEGVETDEQLSMLEQMNCEYVQGFLFAKPLSEQDARKLLSKS